MSTRHVIAMIVVGLACAGPIAHAQERARLLSSAGAGLTATFDVFVPPAPDAGLDALLADQVTPGSPRYHKFLTPAAYRARFGTSPARMSEVAGALRREGFVVRGGTAHVLRVSGPASLIERVFATRLSDGVFRSGRHALVTEHGLHLPLALARAGAVVAGFSSTIRMHRHSRPVGRVLVDRVPRAGREGPYGPYWITDLKQAYDLPDERVLNGAGVGIGILMAGNMGAADMKMYFASEGIPVPAMSVVDVYGGSPYDPEGSTETNLDVQQAGGMAPKAAITLYNLPDLSDASILAGLVDIDESNQVDIVSMSFGAPELLYTGDYNGGQDYTAILQAMDVLFKQGNAEGITFVASSGDGGALAVPPPACFAEDAGWDCGFFEVSVEHPASSPYVTAVGGTNLQTYADPANPADLNSAYASEQAYFDLLAYDTFFDTPAMGGIWGSGGGYSLFEPQPSWQSAALTGSASFRAVPDIAGHMGGCPGAAIQPCPAGRSADIVAIDQSFQGVVGTSASAPDIAGILALKAQHLQSRLGNVNAELYALGARQRNHGGTQVFRETVPGNNGFYPASGGYNLVLGNGTPFARRLIGVPQAAAAGVPFSDSNP